MHVRHFVWEEFENKNPLGPRSPLERRDTWRGASEVTRRATDRVRSMNEHVVAKSSNLVLHLQFLSLQFHELEVVDGGVGERVVDFLLERFVTFLKFRKMRFNRHVSCLLASVISGSHDPTPGHKTQA